MNEELAHFDVLFYCPNPTPHHTVRHSIRQVSAKAFYAKLPNGIAAWLRPYLKYRLFHLKPDANP
jgi:hypothetical protein